MRNGAIISGSMHGIAILAVILGTDWLHAEDDTPFQVTEVSLVDGEVFDAINSTAPVVQSEGPADLSDPENSDATPDASETADESVTASETSVLAWNTPKPEAKPEKPEIALPPPPTDVPTEAPRISIAELPTPDILPEQAKEPESKPTTEPLQPLASAQQAPDPAPEPLPLPEPLPEEAEKPEERPDETDPETEVAEAQPDAPESLAPEESRIPVAKPADRPASAPPASKTEQAEAQPPASQEEPKAAETPEDTRPSGSQSVFAQRVTRGEKDALQLGIKQYFVYNGSPDRRLWVKIAIEVDRSGRIIGQPKLLEAEGGTEQSQRALFASGRRALIKAENAGEFAKLPANKHDAWKLIHVRFTPNAIGFSS
ncbi:MAG: hypothetical protein AAGE80_02665 [Pseudomonadota bacterium]